MFVTAHGDATPIHYLSRFSYVMDPDGELERKNIGVGRGLTSKFNY